ncbi:hypothetical protein ACB094_01G152600 [Castanea mollissima]
MAMCLASTLCLKLLCPLHPWLWNQTLIMSSPKLPPATPFSYSAEHLGKRKNWSALELQSTPYQFLHLGLNLNISVSVSIFATRFHLGLSQYFFVFDFRSLFFYFR